MSIDITMPALSPTMEKATLARWRVAPGDAVKTGDIIAEVETDKATMEIEAAGSGIVAELLVSEGAEDIPVGRVIAHLVRECSAATLDAPAAVPAAPPALAHMPSSPATAPAKATPLAKRLAFAEGIDLSPIRGPSIGSRIDATAALHSAFWPAPS